MSPLIRDITIVSTAVFMLVYQTVIPAEPSDTLVWAALGMLSLPPLLRVDQRVNNRNGGR